MKLNATSATAACLIVGLGGFLVGKVTTAPSEKSEADRLLESTDQLVNSRTSSGGPDGERRGAGNRPLRPGSERSDSTFDERLAKMEEIVRGENALDRGRAMLDWIDSLAAEDFEGAVARFRSLGLTEARMGEYAMLLTAWAEVDPIAALTYTKENTRGGMATGTVLSAWASRDPEGAIQWANNEHEGDGANPYMVGIIRGLAGNNPTRATEILQELPFSRERGQALGAMMPHLMKMGAEASKTWISNLADDQLRDGAIARFSEQMAKEDPEGTATWLLANLGESSTRSVDEVYEEWAKKDSAAALATIGSVPEGAARSRALRGVITVEARENPGAAAALMDRYADEVDDSTVMHFVWNSFREEPAIAMSQVSKIEDEGRRNRMYSRTLESWINNDQVAAQRWIDSADLPDSVIRRLPQRETP
ncbi:MAG: hypothetical protein AB8D78_10380 [Akkermansiaceae bacterium]